MITKRFIPIAALATLLFVGCGREYQVDCVNPQIQTGFINYARSDVDTFILRKFKTADNYHTLLDTFKVTEGWSGVYSISNDTTTVFIPDGKNGLRAGFDWQIFIPATNKTIFVSDIVGEKNATTCRSGIFSMDKQGCACSNRVFSAKVGSQAINFPAGSGKYTIYLRN
jgi:hypothetical protein